MKGKFIIIFVIIFILFTYSYEKDNIKYMNIFEILEYNYKLYLIKNAGITNLFKTGSRLLDYFTNDPLLIKMHRKLNKKYGKFVITYIVNSKNYYILDSDLSKQILTDSPNLFDAGNIKDDFFKSFMPNNLGISKCNTSKCPWKNRRQFNENVLSTNKNNNFLNCIPSIVNKNINSPLLNIDDFKNVSYNIISQSIYGDINHNEILKKFTEEVESENIMSTDFYKEYKKDLHNSYNNSPSCSLLYYANVYKNDTMNIIDDQIPHWFGPFIFIINYLIPNLLCIIINFKDIHQRILSEINNKNFNVFENNTYLHYCVIEHIRLFNTININIQRTIKEDMVYNNINFKKGEQIFILFSSILRNQKEFYRSDDFIPERWETKSVIEQDIVFGVGPQQCPSKNITPIYYKSIIYHLLKTFKYDSVYPTLYSKQLYFINPYDINFSIL